MPCNCGKKKNRRVGAVTGDSSPIPQKAPTYYALCGNCHEYTPFNPLETLGDSVPCVYCGESVKVVMQ